MIGWLSLVTTWTVFTKTTFGVHLTDLKVPPVAFDGRDVHLRCDYEEERGSSLYTLRWFKDGIEFFRHQPGSPHRTDGKCSDFQLFPVDGVNVDCWLSTERDVVLTSVSSTTSGLYRCEVIGEHPTFRKEYEEGHLTVYREELQEPEISGHEESYSSSDIVSLNCSSINTEYTPQITWIVNGHSPSQENLLRYSGHRVGLTFRAADDLFVNGVIQVTCVTSLQGNVTRSTHIRITNKDYLMAQGYYFNSGYMRSSSSCVCMIVYSVLLALLVLNPSV